MFKITPTDSAKEVEGVWADYYHVQLLIARANNNVFKTEFLRLQRPYKREIKNDSLSERQSLDILCKALAKGVLLDWKDSKGKLPEYSQDAGESLLKNDDDCRAFVLEFANDQANYYKEEMEERLEKSEKNSDGD